MYSLLRALPRAVSRVPAAVRSIRIAQPTIISATRGFSVYSPISFPATAATAKKTSSASEKPKKPTGRTKATPTTTKKTAGATTKKSTAKKTSTKKAAKAKKVVKKKPAKKVSKPKKKEVPKFKVTKEMMPPHKPPSPFILYSQKLVGDQRLASVQERQTHISNSAAQWNALSPAEQEPFFVEGRALSNQYTTALQEWWRNADPKVVRAINLKLRAKKKPTLSSRRAPEDKRPPNMFTMFLSEELRKSALVGSPRTEINSQFKEATKKWSAMADEEKALWKERAAKKKAEWLATRPEKAGASPD